METKDTTKKRLVLASLIIVMSIVIIGISISYAYFLNTIEEVNSSNQGLNITSGELTMNFTTERYIKTNSASLINDAEITSKADYTSFSVTMPSSSSADSATYNLYLTELNISDNLKNGYVKWALYDGSGSNQIANGNFASATTGTNLTLKNNITISKGNTNSYRLYIWLSNDPNNNQIDLLNGTLSAKVGFTATT